jgi:hypothetical protein
VEEGEIDAAWLTSYLVQQVPQAGSCHYALDGTGWPRSRARTMDDRQYLYLPTQTVNGCSICVGYPYSLLDWVPEPQSSWSLSVSVQRIPSHKSAQSVGVEEVMAFNEAGKTIQMC